MVLLDAYENIPDLYLGIWFIICEISIENYINKNNDGSPVITKHLEKIIENQKLKN